MENGRGAMAKGAASAGGISCDLSREKSDGVLPWGSGGSKAWEHRAKALFPISPSHRGAREWELAWDALKIPLMALEYE